MNIMDKNEFIEIYNKFLNHTADNQDATKLIENYCIKMGKDSKESLIFAQQIVAQGLPINYNKALDYFAKEFNVTEIYNKNNQLIKIL
jgi:hypothetical protein